MSILQALYDSEINCCISSYWHNGWNVTLGDKDNGFKASTTVDTIEKAEAWLSEQACIHYPNSAFAKSRQSA